MLDCLPLSEARDAKGFSVFWRSTLSMPYGNPLSLHTPSKQQLFTMTFINFRLTSSKLINSLFIILEMLPLWPRRRRRRRNRNKPASPRKTEALLPRTTPANSYFVRNYYHQHNHNSHLLHNTNLRLFWITLQRLKNIFSLVIDVSLVSLPSQ